MRITKDRELTFSVIFKTSRSPFIFAQGRWHILHIYRETRSHITRYLAATIICCALPSISRQYFTPRNHARPTYRFTCRDAITIPPPRYNFAQNKAPTFGKHSLSSWTTEWPSVCEQSVIFLSTRFIAILYFFWRRYLHVLLAKRCRTEWHLYYL